EAELEAPRLVLLDRGLAIARRGGRRLDGRRRRGERTGRRRGDRAAAGALRGRRRREVRLGLRDGLALRREVVVERSAARGAERGRLVLDDDLRLGLGLVEARLLLAEAVLSLGDAALLEEEVRVRQRLRGAAALETRGHERIEVLLRGRRVARDHER